MDFQKEAYLYDTDMLNTQMDDSVYGVLSFASNPLYLSAFASEAMRKFDMTTVSLSDFSDWITISQNNEEIAPFLIKLHDNVGELGLSSFLIEKEYSLFIYLLGLMFSPIDANDIDLKEKIDALYFDYQWNYYDGIKRDDIAETISVFNQRIQSLLKQSKNKGNKSVFLSNARKVDEQLSILKQMQESGEDVLFVTDYFFYGTQILDSYRKNEVHDVFASGKVMKRFTNAINRFPQSTEFGIVFKENQDNISRDVNVFAKLVLTSFQHIIGTVIETKDIENLSEEDKYLFITVWMIFQSSGSNMFINSRCYDLIRRIFDSLKKEIIF